MPGGTGVAYAVAQSEIGLAIETVKGTAATAPSYMIPVKGPKYKPDLTIIPDETLQGSMVSVYDLVQGMRYDAHGWDSFPYLDSFPLFVRAELGSADTLTTGAAATTLSASAVAGAVTVDVTAAVTAGTYIVIGSGGTLETHKVTSIAALVVTLATPLIYAQPSGAVVTSLTSHEFSLLNNSGVGNQPPSLTLWDNDGEQWRQMTACQIDELTIKGNATGLVDYTCTWFGNPASNNVTAPTVSYTDTQTPAPWTFTASIGGSAVGTIVDWEFDFKRGVKPIPALTGTQEYFEYFANTLEATGKLTFVEQSGSPYISQYLNGTRQTLDFSIFDLESGFVMDIASAKVQYKTGDLDRSKEWVEVPVEFQLLPSSTNATSGGVSPVAITIANSVTTTY